MEMDQHFRRYNRNNNILIIQALAKTLTFMSHLLMIYTTMPSLVKKKSKLLRGSEDVERTWSDTWIGWQLVVLVLWAQSTKNGQSDSNIFLKGGGQNSTFQTILLTAFPMKTEKWVMENWCTMPFQWSRPLVLLVCQLFCFVLPVSKGSDPLSDTVWPSIQLLWCHNPCLCPESTCNSPDGLGTHHIF